MTANHLVAARTVQTDDFSGRLFEGLGEGPHPGVLVLHGGGGPGGYEQAYARRLAHHGYTALCVAYFDAPAAPAALQDVPIEIFAGAAEWLLDRPDVAGDEVGLIGFSRGGEAALLAGAHFEFAAVVITHVSSGYSFPAPTWMAGVEEEGPSWTIDGEPHPYLPVERYVEADHEGIADALDNDDPNASRLAVAGVSDQTLAEATIAVEGIEAPVLVVSGGLDEVLPSAEFGERIVDRLADHDHSYRFEHRLFPDAGHAIRVPFESDGGVDPAEEHAFGGTHASNARAAAEAWLYTQEFLALGLR